MKFLDIKTDFAFKKVFGSAESKDILIDFLNSLIEFNDHQHISDLTILDPYNIPLLKGMKDTFVDVKAELSDGSKVIIEMQVLNHEGLEKRILYNAAKNYSVQLQKGDTYHLLNPVIALTITDYCIPKNINPPLEKAFNIANEANLSEEELELQQKKRDWVYIQKSSIELAKKSGFKEGLEQGIKKGIEKVVKQGIEQGKLDEKIAIMQNAHQIGLPMSTISKLTGVDEEEIIALLRKYQ